MNKDRLTAFSDGVFAIIITIMVLELKVPHATTWSALLSMTSIFHYYVLSFIYLAISWHNHHHLLHALHRVNGKVLWANTHLLFWLSLVPFATAWLGEAPTATIPNVFYGLILLLSASAFFILKSIIFHSLPDDSSIKKAFGKDWKGKISLIAYALGIILGFILPWAAIIIYSLVAAMWFVPDQRIEKALA